MYLAMILLLMGALPVASLLVEYLFFPGAGLVELAGRWFVFWGVGVRLGLAGLRQIAQPEFTASTIFDIKDPAAATVVQELGFANLAMGLIAVVSVMKPGWVLPAAVAAALFYGLAGIKHVLKGDRNFLENVATVSDLWMAAVLVLFVIATLATVGFRAA